jgi:hypothetical protein
LLCILLGLKVTLLAKTLVLPPANHEARVYRMQLLFLYLPVLPCFAGTAMSAFEIGVQQFGQPTDASVLWFGVDFACVCPIVFHLCQVHFREDAAVMLRPNAKYKHLTRLEALLNRGQNPTPADYWWLPGGLVFGGILFCSAGYILLNLFHPHRLVNVSTFISVCLSYSHWKNKLY